MFHYGTSWQFSYRILALWSVLGSMRGRVVAKKVKRILRVGRLVEGVEDIE